MRKEASSLLRTEQLTKRYGRVTALSDCSLRADRAEVLGLLGPNGSGKTTLLRLLLGYIRPTAGKATIAGNDCTRDALAVRQSVSYLPGEPRLFRRMRARNVLSFFAQLRGQREGISRGERIARRLDLDLTPRVSKMSTGMRQKLALAVALAPDVPLIILDEPTSSLDPNVREEVARLVREARDEGRSVLFSSHVLPEVEAVCDRVIILRRGRLVHTQVMGELRKQHRIRAQLRGDLPEPPPELADDLAIHREQENVTIDTPGELSRVLTWLASLPLAEVHVEPLGLTRVYERYHEKSTLSNPL